MRPDVATRLRHAQRDRGAATWPARVRVRNAANPGEDHRASPDTGERRVGAEHDPAVECMSECREHVASLETAGGRNITGTAAFCSPIRGTVGYDSWSL
jgi:hypothetical protein